MVARNDIEIEHVRRRRFLCAPEALPAAPICSNDPIARDPDSLISCQIIYGITGLALAKRCGTSTGREEHDDEGPLGS